MIESFVYGLLATGVMLAINKFVTNIFIKVKNNGLALVYGSLAAKLVFLKYIYFNYKKRSTTTYYILFYNFNRYNIF